MLADKFKLAGTAKRSKPTQIEDYAILDTPEFAAWHQATLLTLSGVVKGLPTFADLQSGKVSIEEGEQITHAVFERQLQKNAAQRERENAKRTSESV